MRDGDVNRDLDALSTKTSARIKDLVDSNKEESNRSETKFDEMMARLKATAAAHKANIRSAEPLPVEQETGKQTTAVVQPDGAQGAETS